MAGIRYIDVCSGISAPTMAWKSLGWKALCFAEIEAFPRAVLAHHYPDVPLRGDFTEIEGTEYGPVDLLVGGTPCQSFSVAGLRGGLADDRGNLALEYLRLADRARPRWLVWENVPGVLSSEGGRDFGAILGGMVELGYGVAYRVLDAQFFGVPQRRRRVFVVGYLGDWRRAAAVLFERHSLSGHPAPRREKGPGVAALTSSGVGTCGADDNQAQAGHLIASTGETSHCLNAGGMGRQDYETETLIAHAFDARQSDVLQYGDISGPMDTGIPGPTVCFTAKDHGADASDISPTLRSGSHSGSHANGGVMPAVAIPYDFFNITAPINRQNRKDGDPCHTLARDNACHATIQTNSAVRRLTPRECERLQGFPDDFTLVPYRGKPAADGPRYKALGNSMAVPVVRWIGERIAQVEALASQAEAA